MAEKKAFGARGNSGGSRGGTSGPRKEYSGERKPYAKREGGSSGGYERKPRAEGERSYAPRADGERKPYAKREGGYAAGGERKPYVKREGGYSSDRPARAYTPREGGERRPYEGSNPRPPREGGYERKSYGDGERKPYVKREGGYERKSFGDGERKPYAKREGGYERKSFGDGERKPYVKREGGYERKSFGDGERKPYVKRDGVERKSFDSERPARGPKREDMFRGDSKSAKFAEKRTIKRDRTPADDNGLMRGDGWLIGYHAVLAALSTGRRKVREIWLLSDAQGELGELIAKNPNWVVSIKPKPEFEKQFGDMVHQGVAALVGNLPQPSLPELLSDKPQLVVALDQITDPHNLGAIVRSCAAFGAKGVLVTEHRAAGLNATAAKVAAGAMEVVPVVEITNLAQSLEMMKEAGFTVLGMAGEAEVDIADVKVSGPICLVLGSEGEGLRRLTRETCDQLVKIAIAPTMESLNVSVATGVALSILTRK